MSSSSSTLDLYNFEEVVLPKYIDLFSIDFNNGDFRYTPSQSDTTPSIYGISDVIHVLYIVDQISVYLSNKTTLQSWIDKIHSFQNITGFYKLESSELNGTGYQPWHSSAYATASLYVLNAKPLHNNSYYSNIATNQSLWNSTFYSLLNYTLGMQQGCDNIHDCAHKIVGIPATIFGEGNQYKYSEFISWWFNDFMYPNLNSEYGVLCPQKDIQEIGIQTCLGSGAAQHFFYTFSNTSYPYPMNVYDFMGLLENNESSQCAGLWNPSCSISSNDFYSNMDGITQFTNSAKQMDYYEWNTTVKSKCEEIIEFYTPKLNNQTLVLTQMANDTHILQSIVAAVGQCNMYFPNLVQTKYNWRCCAPFM